MSDNEEFNAEKTQIYLPGGQPMGGPKAGAEPAADATEVDFDITAGTAPDGAVAGNDARPAPTAEPPPLDAQPAAGSSSRPMILVTLAILSVVAYLLFY
ncbi:MAG: hypothetical protein ACU85V_19125 [Gammaproteobacteria bacterium]